MDKRTMLIIFLAVAAIAIAPYVTSGDIIYQKEADTLTTTGTMNTGLTQDFYLANSDLTDIHVDGNWFADASASGAVRVRIDETSKYCRYNIYKESGTSASYFMEVFWANTVTNDLKMNVKVTQPDGTVTTKENLNPFNQAAEIVYLSQNPDRPGVPVPLRILGKDATAGSTQCDDRTNFVILRFAGQTITMKADEYKIRVNSIFNIGDPIGTLSRIADLFSIITNPNSQLRYDKPLELGTINSGYVRYYEPDIGNALVQVTVPFWAYNTVVYQKTPDGKAQINSCAISKTGVGSLANVQLVYTNIGDTSKFYYTFQSSYYSVPTVSNSGYQVLANSQKSEIFPVTAIASSSASTVFVSVKGESGIETVATCHGDTTGSGGGATCGNNLCEGNEAQTCCQDCGTCGGSNQTSSCIPIIQHPKTEIVGGNYLDLWLFKIYLGGGTEQTVCETDYIGLIVSALFSLFAIGMITRRR